MLTFQKEIPDGPTYFYASNALGERDLAKDMAEVWAEVFKRVRDNRPDGTWNRLLIELWCADGFVKFYPQKRGESPDKRAPSIVISLAFFDETRRKLVEGDERFDADNLIAIARAKVSPIIRRSYRKEPALSELRRTLESNDFTAWLMPEDDVERLIPVELFF